MESRTFRCASSCPIKYGHCVHGAACPSPARQWINGIRFFCQADIEPLDEQSANLGSRLLLLKRAGTRGPPPLRYHDTSGLYLTFQISIFKPLSKMFVKLSDYPCKSAYIRTGTELFAASNMVNNFLTEVGGELYRKISHEHGNPRPGTLQVP